MAASGTADLGAFRAAPERAAVITDFDGTLAPIVDDPAAAVAFPGVVDALHELAQHYGCVAVVSGRPVQFLRDRLELDERPESGLVVSGLYGLERLDGQDHSVHPEAVAWQPAVDETAARAEAAAPAGVGVERKGLSVTLHVRNAPQLAAWARSWARASAAATGLAAHAGRMSWELRPPLSVDKGTVVADLVAEMQAACFLGDDVGDLSAFDALDRMAARAGTAVVRVGVRSEEAPPELIERADVLVEGPEGSLAFLRQLLD
ncbi:MAG: trehalose-phosphatase [Actinomycetota bacterium]|nr:trehalose-phosphatase [Actinomycetota bacterium]